MSGLEKTNKWINLTKENEAEQQAYTTAIAKGESTSMFKTTKRRHGQTLNPRHNIHKYDQTMCDFIKETSEIVEMLNNKIANLEEQIIELKK